MRSVQTLFPFLHDLRFTLKLAKMRISGNPHEEDFNALRKFNPNPDQEIIDVGSNRGEAIQSMLVTLKSQNKIIGFEPNELVFNKLEQYYSNNSRIKVHNYGLADKNEELDLYIPFYRKWMFDGFASFKQSEAAEWLKTRMWGYDETKLTIKQVKCKLKTLDEFNFNPYFMKLDVQGYELEVLKGAHQTLKNHTPILLTESLDQTTVDFLQQFGYESYHYELGQLKKGLGELNTISITPEKFESIA